MSSKIPTPAEPELAPRKRKRSPHANRPENTPAGPGSSERGGRTMTLRVERDRLDALKAVVDNIGPQIGQRTMADVVRTAIDKHLTDLQNEHNKGEPFPQYR